MKSNVISKKTEAILKVKNEEQDSEGSRKDDTEKEDVFVSLEMLMVWKVFKRLLQVVTVKSVK